MFVEEACLKCISKYLNQVSEFKYLNWIIDFNSELDYNPKAKYKRWLASGSTKGVYKRLADLRPQAHYMSYTSKHRC